MNLEEKNAYLLVIFEECLAMWKITNLELSFLIDKYKLSDYILKDFDYYNTIGEKGVVKELQRYITEQSQYRGCEYSLV